MSYHDMDWYEPVYSSGPGWAQMGMRLRTPEEYTRIKAEKQRQHEDAVLAEAEAIKARRAPVQA